MTDSPLHLFSTAEAATLFQSHFGITATASPLPGERDLNFRMDAEDGRSFILKIYAPETDMGWLEAQDALLTRLAAAADLPVPLLQLSLDGASTITVADPDGKPRAIRCLGWLDGRLWSEARAEQPLDFGQIGRMMARLDKAAEGFTHLAARREFLWDIAQAPAHRQFLEMIEDVEIRKIVTGILDHFDSALAQPLAALPRQVIHNDANDNNLVVDAAGNLCGLIDFGDFIESHRICEVAVAVAYGMLGQNDPVGRACEIVAGYHAINPLSEAEVEMVYGLARVRLAESVCMAAQQYAADPENEYLLISQADVRDLLRRMQQINPHLAYFRLRDACGWEPCPGSQKVVNWLSANADSIGPVCDYDVTDAGNLLLLQLSEFSSDANNQPMDAAAATDAIFTAMAEAGATVGVGGYLEDRTVYDGDFFETANPAERRTLHLGIDLFIPAEEPLYAPLDGTIVVCNDNARDYDYGPMVILEHETSDGTKFWTKYGHLSRRSLPLWEVGKKVSKGDVIAYIGPYPENGNWAPHVHFQLNCSLMDMGHDVFGVGSVSEWDVWASICPSPNLILGMPITCRGKAERPGDAIRTERARHLSPNLSTSYRKPLKMVRGRGQYLYTDSGEQYLDLVNNVCHVGHAHQRVAAAACQQIPELNTNTRYLHDNIVNYARELLATFPDPLSVCFFVNSGSEANDLALRLSQAYTGRREMLIVDHAYHGNLTSLIDLSPYKFNRKGGKGCPDHVRLCPMPDGYRGPVKWADPDCGGKYADMAIEQLRAFEADGRPPAAFIAESLLGCGGQIVMPEGYLPKVYEAVRASGGLTIADEVQVGFGRVGSHMWGFELQDVVPDIVTLGKPIGNGHPLGAVITTRAVADAFNTGMEYFNTFGGNPVSCAIGMEVLRVIQDERLQANAKSVGDHLMDGFRALQPAHPLMGEVRGRGLFIGVELVRDHDSLEPATAEAGQLVNLMRESGILMSTDGPLDNVIKIKPPVCITIEDADRILVEFDRCLKEVEGRSD